MTTAADKLDILDIAYRFDFTIDGGEFDDHVSLFADDFSFESDFGDFDSISGYREWVEGFHEQMQEAGGTRHLTVNPVVSVEGDTGHLKAYLAIYAQGDGSLLGTATFDDHYVRTDEGWKLLKRTLSADANVDMGG